MEAEHHLSAWASMSKDQRWTAPTLAARDKELPVNGVAVAALERDLFRNHKLC